ncbi:MAG: LPXTG cell wall anchor domain-containing protein [Bdellovibrionales bacterium]|nr:LPXTG cell wall anchor domain-containing protein [Bdellovibrionales bacterium]
MKILLIFTLVIWGTSSFAKSFSSKYCQFELPPGWECALEGTEYVCQSENADRKKESIIILAAKIRGEQDSLDEYMAYLKKPKEFALPGGKKQISEAKSTKMSRVNDHQWVDALHLASEVPGFYTRYLATVKEDLGVAVTFSVGKDQYAAYLPVMDKLVSTLRVFRQKKAEMADLRSGKNEDPNFGDTTFNPNANMDLAANKTKPRGVEGGGDNSNMIILGLVLAGAVAFIVAKSKKKKGKPKKKQE